MQGLTIVISPLLSLMIDQVQQLPKCLPGACFSSLLKYKEKQQMIKYVKNGQIKILYISPETLQTDLVYHFGEFPKINFIAIDEAHCISEWSHNFRTSYLVIEKLINKHFDHPTILLTTATSTNQTTKSIQEKIPIADDSIFKSDTVVRENLKLSVSQVGSYVDKPSQLMLLLSSETFKDMNSIIIYCKYVSQTWKLAEFIQSQGIKAKAYNAKLEDWKKNLIQREFMTNQIRVICCTVSFAMGIDKSNVRGVIHYTMPKTIENYVQEVGRAGRDGEDSYCHLFINDQDYLKERSWVFAEQIDQTQIDLLRDIIVQQYQKVKNNKRKLTEDGKENSLDIDDLNINQEIRSISVNDFSKELDMKKESITTLMLEIQKLFKTFQIKVLPECAQKVSLKFYKEGHDHQFMSEKHSIVEQLISVSKNDVYGTFQFQMVDACNKLNLEPIQIISRLKKLAQDGLGYDLKQDIIPFKFIFPQKSEQEFKQSDIVNEFEIINEQLFDNLNLHTETLFRKIDVMFLTAKQCAYPNIQAMSNQNIQKRLNKMNMNKYFDKYFSILGNNYLNIFDQQEKIDNIDIFLPFREINYNIKTEIFQTTMSFLTEQSNLLKSDKLSKFRNSKIVTRIFQGIASFAYTREEWGKYRPYWEQYDLYKYEEVKEKVEEACQFFFKQKDVIQAKKLQEQQKEQLQKEEQNLIQNEQENIFQSSEQGQIEVEDQ